jgi:hypothetical protein
MSTDGCLEKDVCLSAYCIATAVLVRFEVSAQQRVYKPQYDGIKKEGKKEIVHDSSLAGLAPVII